MTRNSTSHVPADCSSSTSVKSISKRCGGLRALGSSVTPLYVGISLLLSSALMLSLSYAQPQRQTQGASARGEDEQGSRELDEERARKLFKAQCARCHGTRGDGRGSLASAISPRPTDLTNPIWYRGTSPARLKRVILGGGGSLGKSVLMPAYPELRDQPGLTAALIDYIISLAPREEKED